jgi:hypothetical protein
MNLHKAAFPPFGGGMQAVFWISRRRWLEESREAIARCNLKKTSTIGQKARIPHEDKACETGT